MEVELLTYTQNADMICASAGESCYSHLSSAELIKRKTPANILGKIIDMGHHSVIEHASFTFSVHGISRALTHQLVRHRIASFSQQSQRYVSIDVPSYITPETVTKSPERKKIYDATMAHIWQTYNTLRNEIPAEDARYILPNGCTTNITITMNARELLHFFSLRCCNRSQWEIRDMADQMLHLCRKVSPVIFKNAGPPCVRGTCPEKKLSCGHPRKFQ